MLHSPCVRTARLATLQYTWSVYCAVLEHLPSAPYPSHPLPWSQNTAMYLRLPSDSGGYLHKVHGATQFSKCCACEQRIGDNNAIGSCTVSQVMVHVTESVCHMLMASGGNHHASTPGSHAAYTCTACQHRVALTGGNPPAGSP
jgi:hypothetical protein